MAHTTAVRLTRAAIPLLLLAGLLVGCGDDDDPGAGSTTTEAGATTTAATPTTTSVPRTTEPTPGAMTAVNVYWAWTIDAVTSGTPERLGAGGRDADAAAPARAAIEALLEGPNPVETEIGMSSAVPAGTELLGLTVAEGEAVIDLSSEFETPSGTLAETTRAGQVVFTLTQFDTVERVRFRIDGEPRDALGSHGLDVSGGVSRDDFEAIRPFILVEQPTPGQTVDDPIAVSGEANTFEANVEWVLTDAEGLIVDEGFTSATAGNGQWGEFEFTTPVPAGVEGRGALIVFETSAADGSQINVVEYPIRY